MAAVNTPTTLASRLKEVYPNGITELVPKCNELFGKRLKFRKDLKPGELVRLDVQLSPENGFSCGVGDFTLNDPVAQVSAKAEISDIGVCLRSRVSYDAITRARDDKQAFVTFNDSKYIPAAESFKTRCELLSMGYGRQGLGVLSADDDGAGVLTISAATWAPAMWMTMIGAVLQSYTALTGGSQHDGDMVVTAVDVANRQITVSGTSTSQATGDILFLKGHRGVAPIGLMDIAKNTGTLYNISAASYDLWKANSYDVGTSALTLGKIALAAAKSADKGCNEDLTCLVPTAAFQALVTDQSALREHGADYKHSEAETGFESIVFWGATGKIRVVPYMFSKQGEFVMFPERYTSIIGSEEGTNQVDKSGDVYFDLPDSAAKELRFFACFTVYSDRPGWITWGNRSDGLALHT